MWVSLTTEGAKNDTPFFGSAGGGDGIAAEGVHFGVVIGFAAEGARVRIVAISGYGGVMDHGRFEVEAAVTEVQQVVDLLSR